VKTASPMRYTLLIATICSLSACYESHAISGDASIGAPVVDVGARRDVFDAGLIVDGRRDASSEAGAERCELVQLDHTQVRWESLDCGSASHPQATAVQGAAGPFQLVVTERRFCDGPPGDILSRRVSIEDDRLRVHEPSIQGLEQGPVHVASNGTEFAVCSGTALHVSDGAATFHGELREAPRSVPGCFQSATCLGLAHDGAGWAAIWDFFECDVVLHELSRSGERGGLRGPIARTDSQLWSIAQSPAGAVALSGRLGLGNYRVHRWASSEPEPTTIMLGEIGIVGPTAIAQWPFAEGSWALVSTEAERVTLRVIDEAGRVSLERTHVLPRLMNYGPTSVSVAVTDFGLAASIHYDWLGGRIGEATAVVVFDSEGASIGPDLIQEFENVVTYAHVAASGDYLLVHRTDPTPDPTPSATEILLFACR
jgi:hypothetical protein